MIVVILIARIKIHNKDYVVGVFTEEDAMVEARKIITQKYKHLGVMFTKKIVELNTPIMPSI